MHDSLLSQPKRVRIRKIHRVIREYARVADRAEYAVVVQGHGICVSGGLDGLAVVWDIRRGAMQHALCRGSDPVVSVAIDEEVMPLKCLMQRVSCASLLEELLLLLPLSLTMSQPWMPSFGLCAVPLFHAIKLFRRSYISRFMLS